jgi:peptide/nickel transport system ATP-binding protein
MVIETGTPAEVFGAPLHPYSRGLRRSYPDPWAVSWEGLAPIPGAPPDLARPAPGCAFEPRCAERKPECAVRAPAATQASAGRQVRCVLHGG